MEEKSRYDKKQSEMKKKQEEDRKKFIEKNRENSGRESFRINRVFNSLRSFCGLKIYLRKWGPAPSFESV